MHSLTERHDPDFICSWCVKRAGGKPAEGVNPEYHDAFCRYCHAYTQVAVRTDFAFPPNQDPQQTIPGSSVVKFAASASKRLICWACIRKAGGAKRFSGYVHWIGQARCAFCGHSRRTADVSNFNFTTQPEILPRPARMEGFNA